MTLPANIRVNVGAPFPALVKATGPIGITRANGIWTVSLSAMVLAAQIPPASSYPNDYVLVYDSLAGTWFRMPLSEMAGDPTQRSITTVPVVISPTDEILHLNLTVSTTVPLPSYGARDGVPLIFKDVGGHARTYPITLQPAAGETIDGMANLMLAEAFQAIKITPANDGVNTGWFRE